MKTFLIVLAILISATISFKFGEFHGCVKEVYGEFLQEYQFLGILPIPKDTDQMLRDAAKKVCEANK